MQWTLAPSGDFHAQDVHTGEVYGRVEQFNDDWVAVIVGGGSADTYLGEGTVEDCFDAVALAVQAAKVIHR